VARGGNGGICCGLAGCRPLGARGADSGEDGGWLIADEIAERGSGGGLRLVVSLTKKEALLDGRASSFFLRVTLIYSKSRNVTSELRFAWASMATPARARMVCLANSVLSLAMSTSRIWLLAASRLLRFTARMSCA
jgi:hypothetical protein